MKYAVMFLEDIILGCIPLKLLITPCVVCCKECIRFTKNVPVDVLCEL